MDKENLNIGIKKLLLEWLEQKDFIALTTKSFSYNSNATHWEMYDMDLAGTPIEKDLKSNKEAKQYIKFIEEFKVLDILSTREIWKKKGFSFDEKTQQKYSGEVFNFIYEGLDLIYKNDFILIAPRIFSHEKTIEIIKSNKALFDVYFTSSVPGFVGSMNYSNISKLLSIFHHFHLKENKKTYKDTLYQFCETHKGLLNHVEAQTLIKTHVNKYIEDKERFEVFFEKIKESDYILKEGSVVAVKIDKNFFYTALNLEKVIDKSRVASYLFNLISYLGQKEKKRLLITSAQILKTEPKIKYHTVVFDCLEKNPSVDFEDFIQKIVLWSLHIIDKGQERDKVFNASVTRYFIEKNMPVKTGKEPGDKKNKI